MCILRFRNWTRRHQIEHGQRSRKREKENEVVITSERQGMDVNVINTEDKSFNLVRVWFFCRVCSKLSKVLEIDSFNHQKRTYFRQTFLLSTNKIVFGMTCCCFQVCCMVSLMFCTVLVSLFYVESLPGISLSRNLMDF